jgi:transglutaminase-like putative cysteine protease
MRLQPISSNEADYLRVTDVLDWTEPAVQTLARSLGEETGNRLETARRCFEWVRDHIRHSVDFQMNPVTCSASEALRAGTGFCYAKSHLLVALLRANGIPEDCVTSASCSIPKVKVWVCTAW